MGSALIFPNSGRRGPNLFLLELYRHSGWEARVERKGREDERLVRKMEEEEVAGAGRSA